MEILSFLRIFFLLLGIVGSFVGIISSCYLFVRWLIRLQYKKARLSGGQSFLIIISKHHLAWQLFVDGWLMILIGSLGFLTVTTP